MLAGSLGALHVSSACHCASQGVSSERQLECPEYKEHNEREEEFRSSEKSNDSGHSVTSPPFSKEREETEVESCEAESAISWIWISSPQIWHGIWSPFRNRFLVPHTLHSTL